MDEAILDVVELVDVIHNCLTLILHKILQHRVRLFSLVPLFGKIERLHGCNRSGSTKENKRNKFSLKKPISNSRIMSSFRCSQVLFFRQARARYARIWKIPRECGCHLGRAGALGAGAVGVEGCSRLRWSAGRLRVSSSSEAEGT